MQSCCSANTADKPNAFNFCPSRCLFASPKTSAITLVIVIILIYALRNIIGMIRTIKKIRLYAIRIYLYSRTRLIERILNRCPNPEYTYVTFRVTRIIQKYRFFIANANNSPHTSEHSCRQTSSWSIIYISLLLHTIVRNDLPALTN